MGLFDDLSSPGGLLGALRYQNPNDTPVTNALRQIFGLPPMGAATFDDRFGAANNGGADRMAFDEAGFNNIFTAPKQPSLPAGIRPEQIASSGQLPPPLSILPQDVNQMDAMPRNAQLTQGQGAPQQAVQPSGPNPLDRLSAGFQSFARSGAPLPAIANLIAGIATGERQDPRGVAQSNQTRMASAIAQALVQKGMQPQQAIAIAQAAAADPKIAEKLLPQALGLEPPKTIEEVIARQMAQGGGKPSGDPFDPLRRLEEAKAGGRKAGEVAAERQMTGQLDLPGAVAQAKEGLRLIDELRTHKGRNSAFWHGPLAGIPLTPETSILNRDAYDAQVRLNQIKGGAFLEAFKTLKGGGQITEVEGRKATDAITRMERAQSRAEFDKALSDYEGVIRLGIDRAAQTAGQPAPFGFKGNSAWQEVKPGVRIRQVQ